MNTIESYDELYRTNPTRWAGDFEIDKQVKAVVDEYTSGRPSLLDLGCGIGRTIDVIKNKELFIIGVDFSDEALKIAKKNNPDVKFSKMDMRYLDCSPTMFDFVLSIGSHEHLNPIDFNEVHRIIKPLGLFICVLPCSKKDEGWVDVDGQIEWKLMRSTWEGYLHHFRFRLIDHKLNKGDLFICQPI